MKAWNISLDAGREGRICKNLEVFYGGYKIKGITSLSMILYESKTDKGGWTLIKDSKEKKIKL